MATALERYKYDLLERGNPWDLWTEGLEEAKVLFADLVGARRDEVAAGCSVSSLFSSLLSALEYGRRRRIVTSDLEYPNVTYPVLMQRRRGAVVRMIRARGESPELDPEDYAEAVDEDTALVTAIHVATVNGFRQDLRRISEIAHARGALVFSDAYQSAGTVAIDVRREDVDFLSAGSLKWLLGVPGIAFLYVRGELVESLEPVDAGWLSQERPFEFGAEELSYVRTADRFQSGTWSVPSAYAAVEGMRIILEVGPRAIEERIRSLTERAIERIDERGLRTITPRDPSRRGAIVSIIVRDPPAVERRLRDMGIITSARGPVLRLCPHFYNTEDEVVEAVDTISSIAGS
ncbi:aminotransferase class V-fold PLP-dependent enzyme [Conexivisphaera calida]|uniref:aminotransferase class V-fold PLP-dependent enzyme n=1 Tax=Conexivisphaera calida TaxID=1874277 RepID=UPI00157ABAD2|nr:aminotransferase class V-fold PLP-dependent enzyme [Conexivisphaera calida]